MDQENSVIVALSELQKLEEKRQADEAKNKERQRLEEERAEASRQAAQEVVRRLAEQEIRQKIALDLKRRNAEVEAQIATLRAELAKVQMAREQIRLQLLAGSSTHSPEVSRSRLRLKLAFASAVCIAIVLFSLRFFGDSDAITEPHESDRLELREDTYQVEQAASVSSTIKTDNTSKTQPLINRPDTVKNERSISKPLNNKSNKNPKKRGCENKKSQKSTDLLGDLDKCGDDPTCGLSIDKRN